MVKTEQTFPLYFQDIVDMLVPDDAPRREELSTLLKAVSEIPIVDLAPQVAQLFELLSGFPNRDKLAFQLGAQVPFTAYAPLAIPMKFAPTVGEAIKFLCRFIHLQAPLICPRFTETAAGADIHLTIGEPVSEEAERFIVIAAFVSLSTEIASITHDQRNFEALHLCDASPEALQLFEQMLGVKPVCGGDENMVRIAQKVLETPNPFADPLTFNRYIAQFEEVEREQREERGIAFAIRQKIVARIEAPPSFKELADQMRLTERQLRFALAKENTNYREVLKEARVEFARAQLSNPRASISGLAHRLGYEDVTAFNHGFKRWTGMSPTQFQAGLLKQAD